MLKQQAQNVLILTRDTLAFNRSQRTASGWRCCWWALHAMYNRSQQWSTPRRFISKIGRKVKSEKIVFESHHIHQIDYLCWAPWCFLLIFVCFPVKAYCASIFLNKHAVVMFNEFLFSMGDFGKICLPQPYTTAPLIFLVYWQIFPNFARRGHIGKNSNFDHIFG